MSKKRESFIESTIEAQRISNENNITNDDERMSYIKTIYGFITKYNSQLKKCNSEYQKFNKVEKLNQDNGVTYSAEYSKVVNDLSECTNGLTNIDLYIQSIKSTNSSVILNLENYCIDNCENSYKDNISKLKDCTKQCVKTSYLAEKALEKELSKIILSFDI